MRNKMKRLIALSGAVLVLVLCFPVSVFALDPITDAAIINAWAQAVAAYGAANGVSLNFDISNTDQIGESVHDLWSDYESDMAAQDPLPFTTAATLFWQTGFTRIGNSLGVDISTELAGALDGFWNWLLSGPAEMVKVDNQFVWPENSGTVTPIVVYRSGSVQLTVVPSSFTNAQKFGASDILCYNSAGTSCFTSASLRDSTYVFCIQDSGWKVVWFHVDDGTATTIYTFRGTVASKNSGGVASSTVNYDLDDSITVGGFNYKVKNVSLRSEFDPSTLTIPYYADVPTGIAAMSGTSVSNLSVSPYGDTPGDITIPDNDDVNYAPLPVGIGIDIPWDVSKYGDGTGTLTDTQKGEMVGDIDQQIEETGSVVLDEDAADDPTTDNPSQEVIGGPNDYVVPGLEDVFPFCIPFDIYHFLGALAAEPVAPHFTAQLAFPAAVGGTQTIDLDFNTPTFNQIAQILRTLELLAFIVGLALLTRSMFIRG